MKKLFLTLLVLPTLCFGISPTFEDVTWTGTATGGTLTDTTFSGSTVALNSGTSATTFANGADSRLQLSSTTSPGINTQATDAEVQTGTGTKSVVVEALAAWWTYVKTQVQTWAANQTWNGTSNTMANQTDAGASSVMNRTLTDARGSYFIWLFNTTTATAKADDASWLLVPNKVNTFSTGAIGVPGEFTKFRVKIMFGFTGIPVADTFPVYVRFNDFLATGIYIEETLHGARVGYSYCYPDDTTGLPGTLVDLEVAESGEGNTFLFTSDWITIPAGWQAHAATLGMYLFSGVILGNKSGGSLTDAYGSNHGTAAVIEFQR